MATITDADIAELLHVQLRKQGMTFSRLAAIEDARPDAIVFAANDTAVEAAIAGPAGLIFAPATSAHFEDPRLLCVKDAKYAFALLGAWFDSARQASIHETALVHTGARLGEGVSLGAGTVVEEDAALGDGCILGCNVVVHGRVTLGKNCVVQSGAVLGSTGFGYVRGPDGRYLRFPQQGSLWIGDDVEIGGNSTIDRGALGETRIGRGTKIDNLVHIAHNCVIGEDVIIAAQVGIAGSTVVGDGAILAGQAGLAEHVTIGPGVIVGAQGGVPTGKKLSGPGEVFWGTPARPIRDYLKDLAALRRGK